MGVTLHSQLYGLHPACFLAVDAVGDHALDCPRTALLARRVRVVKHAWIRVTRDAIGAEGQLVPQHLLARTRSRKQRWLPNTQTGDPQPRAAGVNGAVMRRAAGCRAPQAGDVP